ncbi:MAG: bifunctional diaminohydroxyphosphoribosylaminopyrimidine deaminase/5-amino-6-(5-phosphoribosylamino)uracil reductase RibD [Phycisphaeraceae bacterium]|nr:bifunctional diaminohydroxyphosphoribosylaminopyrimidine deaminase/5-amino-6-(5-phosphoribosylamino)uracil reductase RibD [Phycisphaeraceae bacterium]
MSTPAVAKAMLDMAARAALRGAGDVEPNPMVGCVLRAPDGRVIGIGHHRRFGGPHAEVEAIADCRRRGESPAGATAYVTLEPCNAHGKQPPCSEALIAARVAKVVASRRDPNPAKAGGAERLRDAGIAVEFTDASPLASSLADAWVKRLTTGLPWVIAKWAQSIDGRIATRTGDSQWISGEASRHAVHRLRARVDAIIVGIGTVRADNPRLTARGVARVRRVATRVVIDPGLELGTDSALATTASEAPVLVATTRTSLEQRQAHADRLRALGVTIEPFDVTGAERDLGGVSIESLLRSLSTRGAAVVMVEGGAGVLGRMLAGGLIDEARVYVGPLLMADTEAPSAVRGLNPDHLAGAVRPRLARVKRRGGDVELWYRVR